MISNKLIFHQQTQQCFSIKPTMVETHEIGSFFFFSAPEQGIYQASPNTWTICLTLLELWPRIAAVFLGPGSAYSDFIQYSLFTEITNLYHCFSHQCPGSTIPSMHFTNVSYKMRNQQSPPTGHWIHPDRFSTVVLTLNCTNGETTKYLPQIFYSLTFCTKQIKKTGWVYLRL